MNTYYIWSTLALVCFVLTMLAGYNSMLTFHKYFTGLTAICIVMMALTFKTEQDAK